MSSSTFTTSLPDEDRDRGAVLLLVLAVSIVFSLVVLALANFVAADLRYAQVVDAQAKRLASAQSGIDYALDRLRLNQTLCATDVAGSPVSLNGAISPGTPLPQPVNGTDTRVTCKRLDPAIADVAGWSVVIADPLAGDSRRLRVDMSATLNFDGPVFVRDPNRRDTDNNSKIEVLDGDLWYTGAPNCNSPKRSSDLGVGLLVAPTTARGPECTTRLWNDLFSAPPVPSSLPSLPQDPPPVDDPSGCRVFSPGRYTVEPGFSGTSDAYFESGDYHFVFGSEWEVADVNVWVGYPGSPGGLGNCNNAAAADLAAGFYEGRPGATFYFAGGSWLTVKDRGNIEMFGRQQGQHVVSAQALSVGTSDPSAPLIRTRDFAYETDLVIHGLVWAPGWWFTFDLDDPGSKQMLLGGIVVGGLWTQNVYLPEFAIESAESTADTRILLTSTSTMNGATTTVEAVVSYRPHAANLEDRVAVNSFRVVD
jgi:hypothetical protein